MKIYCASDLHIGYEHANHDKILSTSNLRVIYIKIIYIICHREHREHRDKKTLCSLCSL
jgi:hypothetical protein